MQDEMITRKQEHMTHSHIAPNNLEKRAFLMLLILNVGGQYNTFN